MQDPNAQPAPEQGGDSAVNVMMKVKEVLAKLQEVAPNEFPPEAQKLLQTAAASYDGFLQMLMGKPEQGQPAQAPQTEMAAGAKQAVPA
jgi:hypothetical protein